MVFYIKNFSSFIELTRLEHGAMYALGVLIGAVVAGWNLQFSAPLAIGAFVAIFLEIGAFSLNDYFDVKADRANKRIDRPLVRKDVTPETALLLAAIGFIVANALALFISVEITLVVLAFSVLSILYNMKMKKYAIIGNIFVGATMALPFVFGGLIFRNITEATAILAGIAFIMGLGREVMKDIEDMKGDKKVGARTLPIVIGVKKSIYSVVVCYFIGIGLSVVPFLSFFSDKLAYFIVLLTDVLFLWVVVQMLKSQKIETLKAGRKITLIAMFIALIAFLLSSL